MAADLADVLDRAAAVLAELRAVDLDGVGDDTLSAAVLTLQRLRGALDAAEARVLARWDAQGCWRASGAKTGAAWLAWQAHLPISVARQRLRHAKALRTLPAIEEAWGDGAIDRTHVTTLLGARTARTAEVFDREHKTLLDIACESGFTHHPRQRPRRLRLPQPLEVQPPRPQRRRPRRRPIPAPRVTPRGTPEVDVPRPRQESNLWPTA